MDRPLWEQKGGMDKNKMNDRVRRCLWRAKELGGERGSVLQGPMDRQYTLFRRVSKGGGVGDRATRWLRRLYEDGEGGEEGGK
jgi:hypothetical protein